MIRDDLNLSYSQSGWMMSAFAITNGVSQIPSGWLADHFGTRFIILLSVTGVAIAGFFIGFTNSYLMLVILLIVTALLGGGYHPAAATALASSVPDEYRGRSLGVHFVGGSATMWIIPLIAAPMAAAWGWRSPYLILAVPTMLFGIVLYILIGRHTRKTEAMEAEKSDTTEATTSMPTSTNWASLASFLALTVLTGTMVQSTSSYLSLYAVDGLGISDSAAAMLMSVQPGIGAIAAPLGGYLTDRFGSMKVMITISFCAIPLIYLLGMASSVTILIVIMVAIGLVSTARMPTSETYLVGNTPVRRRATVLGIYYFSGTGVSGVLTPVIGSLIDRVGFQTTFAISSAITAGIVALCTLFLWITREHK
jgi:MFS family permease